MGAYGSPELFPPEKQYSYGTYQNQQQYYQRPYKVKKHWGKFVGGFFTGVAVTIITLFCIAENNNVKSVNLSSNSYSVLQSKSYQNESEETLKKQAEGIVKKYLQYPESAVFSNNESDWMISKSNYVDNGYDVMFVLSIKNNSKQMEKTACRVVFSYVGKNVKEESVQIGGKIVYDSSSVSSTSGKTKK